MHRQPASDWIDLYTALVTESITDRQSTGSTVDTTFYVSPIGWDSAQLLLLGRVLERYAADGGPLIASRFYHALLDALTYWVSVYDLRDAYWAAEHHAMMWDELDEEEREDAPQPFNVDTLPEYVQRKYPVPEGLTHHDLANEITDPALRELFIDVHAFAAESRLWADDHPQYEPDPGGYDIGPEPAIIVALEMHDPVMAAFDFWSDEMLSHGARTASMLTLSFDHLDPDDVRHAFLGATRLFQIIAQAQAISRRIDDLAPPPPLPN